MKPVNVKIRAKKAGVVAVVVSPKLSFPRAQKLVTNSSLEPRIVESCLLELNSQCRIMTMPIDSPGRAFAPTEVDPMGSRCVDVKQGHIKTSFSHNCTSFFRSTGLLDRKAATPQRGVKRSV
jgi:hypothetical protein